MPCGEGEHQPGLQLQENAKGRALGAAAQLPGMDLGAGIKATTSVHAARVRGSASPRAYLVLCRAGTPGTAKAPQRGTQGCSAPCGVACRDGETQTGSQTPGGDTGNLRHAGAEHGHGSVPSPPDEPRCGGAGLRGGTGMTHGTARGKVRETSSEGSLTRLEAWEGGTSLLCAPTAGSTCEQKRCTAVPSLPQGTTAPGGRHWWAQGWCSAAGDAISSPQREHKLTQDVRFIPTPASCTQVSGRCGTHACPWGVWQRRGGLRSGLRGAKGLRRGSLLTLGSDLNQTERFCHPSH